MLYPFPIVLASSSPRRSAILSQAGFNFVVQTQNVEEIYPFSLSKTEIPVYLAKLKAQPLLPNLTNELLIAADTIVWINGQVIGKPKDRNDAIAILKALSGNTHEVITGVYMWKDGKEKTFYSTTAVTFKEIPIEAIESYIDKHQPMDKAGAYGIQDWIGFNFISQIEGCYYNVMGFPMSMVYENIMSW